MTNKWYFQSELANINLAMLISSATSTDRYYSAANSISNTIGFKTLNTNLFQYHDFKKRLTTPYKPNDDFYLFTHNSHSTDLREVPVKNLILLGNTEDKTPGENIGDTPVDTYFSTKTKWGNPFYPQYFSQDAEPILILKGDIQAIKTAISQHINNKVSQLGIATETTHSTYLDCRYNPQPDMGHNALIWNNIQTDHHKWEQPKDEKLTTQGLPLWLLTFGWADWTEKAKIIQHKDTDYCLSIVSDYIEPKLNYYVPIDLNFINGKSPFETEQHVKPYDQQNWHPKFNFQLESIAHIINTGPGTVKLPEKITIKNCVFKVKLFDDEKTKNRRFTPEEYETELQLCKWMKRPPRHYIHDTPFYPWCVPEPKVNFKLNFTE